MGKYLEIIEAAAIPTETAQAHEQTEDLREHFEERAGILEHDGGLPRPEAEIEAARITATYARNRGYLWASLRAVFAEYPVRLSQVSATRGMVDTLPFSVAKHAALNGGQVVRQGTFTGPREGMTAASKEVGVTPKNPVAGFYGAPGASPDPEPIPRLSLKYPRATVMMFAGERVITVGYN